MLNVKIFNYQTILHKNHLKIYVKDYKYFVEKYENNLLLLFIQPFFLIVLVYLLVRGLHYWLRPFVWRPIATLFLTSLIGSFHLIFTVQSSKSYSENYLFNKLNKFLLLLRVIFVISFLILLLYVWFFFFISEEVCRCGKKYKYRCNLLRHLKYYCGKEAQFRCTECNYKCKNPNHLKQHINFKHNPNPLLYHCHLCDYASKKRSNLRRHILLHRTTPIFVSSIDL